MTETSSTTQFPPPGSTPPPVSPPLLRSRTDRKVAGVCGGLGQRLGVDPLILRVVIVVLSVFGGSGIVLYAVGWLLIPEEGADRSVAQRLLDQNARPGARSGFATLLVGIVAGVAVLILLGSLLAGLGLGNGHYALDVWPLVVVGGVAAAVWYASRPGGGSLSSAPPTPGATPYGPYGPYAAPAPTTYAPPPPGGSSSPSTIAAAAQPPRPRRPRSVLGPLTLSVAAVAAGVMVLLDRTGATHVTGTVFLAVLLAIVGAGLLVGTFVGRSRGLIVWGVVLALLTASSAVTSRWNVHDTGDVTWRPTSVASVPTDGYTWGAGDVALDLTTLPTSPDPTRITAHLGAGTLVVTVPADAWVQVTADVGIGSIRLPDGQRADGLGRSASATSGADLPAPTHHLILDLNVGAGTVEVNRASS